MIVGRITLKQGKTHADAIAHVVIRTWMRIYGQNQPSGVESIEIRVCLSSKYKSRVLLATYTTILLVYIANLTTK